MGSRVKEHLEALRANDTELQDEYDKLGPRFEAIRALIDARERAGVSQSELARRMKVSPGTISRLESGQHGPRIDTLGEAARALGYRVDVRFVRRRRKQPL